MQGYFVEFYRLTTASLLQADVTKHGHIPIASLLQAPPIASLLQERQAADRQVACVRRRIINSCSISVSPPYSAGGTIVKA